MRVVRLIWRWTFRKSFVYCLVVLVAVAHTLLFPIYYQYINQIRNATKLIHIFHLADVNGNCVCVCVNECHTPLQSQNNDDDSSKINKCHDTATRLRLPIFTRPNQIDFRQGPLTSLVSISRRSWVSAIFKKLLKIAELEHRDSSPFIWRVPSCCWSCWLLFCGSTTRHICATVRACSIWIYITYNLCMFVHMYEAHSRLMYVFYYVYGIVPSETNDMLAIVLAHVHLIALHIGIYMYVNCVEIHIYVSRHLRHFKSCLTRTRERVSKSVCALVFHVS